MEASALSLAKSAAAVLALKACERAQVNRQGELKDFTRIREMLRELFRELAPDFSLRKPVGLMHYIPEHYVPNPHEVKSFKRAAERAGVSFCWISRWETPHTDEELTNVLRML